jgi:transcriptional regulator with XRE-family HTH domain
MKTLKEWREEKFLSPGELAKKAGLPASTIYNLENGKTKPIHRTIRKIAEALGINPQEIDFSKSEI